MASASSIIIAMVLAIGGLLWLAWPFFRDDTTESNEAIAKNLDRLQVYYEQVVASIKDLDEDFATGKLTEEDYQVERETWAARGVKVLDAINTLKGQQPVVNTAPATSSSAEAYSGGDDIDAAIEAAVRKALGAK